MPTLLAVGLVGILAGYFFLPGSPRWFSQSACDTVRRTLRDRLVFQELAAESVSDAVCAFLQKGNPSKPLVLSLHGPWAVGKTYTQQLLARSLYFDDTSSPSAQRCPQNKGRPNSCPGYKVLFGLYYMEEERERELASMKQSIRDHVLRNQQSLIVIEEYEKLDLEARLAIQQMLDPANAGGFPVQRSIIVFTSNAGAEAVSRHLRRSGDDPRKVDLRAVRNDLKDRMFELFMNATDSKHAAGAMPSSLQLRKIMCEKFLNQRLCGFEDWRTGRPQRVMRPSHWERAQQEGPGGFGGRPAGDACGRSFAHSIACGFGWQRAARGRSRGPRIDAFVRRALRGRAQIDAFVPFLPFPEKALRALFAERLLELRTDLSSSHGVQLTWTEAVLQLGASKVQLLDGYAQDGAKEVQEIVDMMIVPPVHAAMQPGLGVQLYTDDKGWGREEVFRARLL